MYPVTYHRPGSLDEAKALFGACESAAFLAGGHTLLPAMKLHLAQPSDLIDLGGVRGLSGIEVGEGWLSVGACTTHADVAQSEVVRERLPALAGLAGSIGDRHVRHFGTIGGALANNDPAADYPAAVLGMGARVVTDRRSVGSDDFFMGLYETVLEPGEIITKVVFPVPQEAGYAKFCAAASRYSIVGVFVARFRSGVRVAVTGAGGEGVFRERTIEGALQRIFRPEAIADCDIDCERLVGDRNGSPAYRGHLLKIMARRAVEKLGGVTVRR